MSTIFTADNFYTKRFYPRSQLPSCWDDPKLVEVTISGECSVKNYQVKFTTRTGPSILWHMFSIASKFTWAILRCPVDAVGQWMTKTYERPSSHIGALAGENVAHLFTSTKRCLVIWQASWAMTAVTGGNNCQTVTQASKFWSEAMIHDHTCSGLALMIAVLSAVAIHTLKSCIISVFTNQRSCAAINFYASRLQTLQPAEKPNPQEISSIYCKYSRTWWLNNLWRHIRNLSQLYMNWATITFSQI